MGSTYAVAFWRMGTFKFLLIMMCALSGDAHSGGTSGRRSERVAQLMDSPASPELIHVIIVLVNSSTDGYGVKIETLQISDVLQSHACKHSCFDLVYACSIDYSSAMLIGAVPCAFRMLRMLLQTFPSNHSPDWND